MGFVSLIRGIWLNCCFALGLLFEVSEGRKPLCRRCAAELAGVYPVCQSGIAREEQKTYFTSSGGVFSYTLCSFRGTTCFLVLCGTNFYHEMFHLHPSSLPLRYTPADPGLGLWLQQQECCRLALGPVLSLLSAEASVRRREESPTFASRGKC